MKALTVRQPWAEAIIRHGKDVENRSSNITGGHRGLIAIHAGQAFDDTARMPLAAAIDLAPRDELTTGAVVGVAQLVDVHHGWTEAHRCSPWAFRYREHVGQHHLVLADAKPITPVPARGFLGLWTLPEEVERAVLEQLNAGA